jgi:hypothetical protein
LRGVLDSYVMPPYLGILFGICLLGTLNSPAAEIRWTARATVSSISGTAFSVPGVATGQAVEIEMVYDSNTDVNGRSFLPIESAFAGRAWFYGQADLGITVRIGENTWTGAMPTIAFGTNVMESVCWDFGGNPDWFKVTLDSARGGTFPSFPQSGNELVRALVLEFRDDTSPAELFDIHVLPDSVTNVCAMTSATGSITAGTSTLAFTIDPSSVSVSQPRVPVSIAQVNGGIQLSWESELGKNYRVEGSSDLRCWSQEALQSGNGALRQQLLTPFATYSKRFYRVVER